MAYFIHYKTTIYTHAKILYVITVTHAVTLAAAILIIIYAATVIY